MQWLKRYSFLVMILITTLGFASVKLMKIAEAQLAEIELEQQLEMEQLAEIELEQQLETEQLAQGDAPEKNEQEEVPQEKREFHSVELDYLADALFIGDSRTSTLYEYAGWDDTDFFVKNGLSIWEVWDKDMDGTYLESMLQQKQYGKIYIMLGVNELGNETAELFQQEYKAVLARIRELQPEAIIFVQAIIHVTAEKDAEGTYINNQEIDIRNQEIKKLTDNRTVFWLDANEVFDEPGTGTLSSEYTFDGVHLKVKHLDVWQAFLLEHGI